jgi:energy-coupling factor transporter transmembrane protein EcfT
MCECAPMRSMPRKASVSCAVVLIVVVVSPPVAILLRVVLIFFFFFIQKIEYNERKREESAKVLLQ